MAPQSAARRDQVGSGSGMIGAGSGLGLGSGMMGAGSGLGFGSGITGAGSGGLSGGGSGIVVMIGDLPAMGLTYF